MPRDSISWRKEINFPLHSGTALKSPALQAEPIERGTTTGKACKFTTSRPEAPAPALSAGWARETHQPNTVGHPIPCNSLFRWKIYSNSSYCKGLSSWLVLRGKRGDKNQARLSRLYPISIWLIAIIGYRLSGGCGMGGMPASQPTRLTNYSVTARFCFVLFLPLPFRCLVCICNTYRQTDTHT